MSWVSMFASLASMLNSVDAERADQLARDEQARENQKIANEAAADALMRGAREAGLARMAGSQLEAKQKVAYANSGVDPNVGTPAAVQAQTSALSEIDSQTLLNNAAREAWGLKTHGLQYAQANDAEARRSRARQQGAILSGIGQMAAAYGRGQGNQGS